MLGLLRKWIGRRKQASVLRRRGFLVFCHKCGQWLNNEESFATAVDDLTNEWACQACGERCRFRVDAPVPIRIDA